MKISRQELNKKGACLGGRMRFSQLFPHGAEFTFENALLLIEHMPPSYIYWFLSMFIDPDVAARYYQVLDKATGRAIIRTSQEVEDRRMARWLLKTVQTHLGGDAQSE